MAKKAENKPDAAVKEIQEKVVKVKPSVELKMFCIEQVVKAGEGLTGQKIVADAQKLYEYLIQED